MNLFTVNFQSVSLHKLTQVNVLCPQGTERTSELPALMLLHGMTDDQTGWLRRSLAENYAEKMGLCLIIPNADLSFYTDMAYGGDYLTFLAEELPEFLRQYFPLSRSKEKNFAAGNSMGGYGAFLLAMSYPQQYKAAFSLSGPMKISWIYRILTDEGLAGLYASGERDRLHREIMDISGREKIPELLISSLLESGDLTKIFRGMFGDGGIGPGGSELDLLALTEKEELSENPVDFYAFCGRQDYHYASNLLFGERMEQRGMKYRLETGDGSHDWDYWNRKLPDVFKTIGEHLGGKIFAEGI